MTDLDISKALALAIGHQHLHVRIHALTGNLVVLNKCYDTYKWQVFDYLDWNVIGPIAAKYDLFPRLTGRTWAAYSWNHTAYADTPQKAIALAAIEVNK